jgi:hypothetical protein
MVLVAIVNGDVQPKPTTTYQLNAVQIFAAESLTGFIFRFSPMTRDVHIDFEIRQQTFSL